MEKQKAASIGLTDKAVTDNWSAYLRARDNGHIDYVERAQRCNNYYLGDQWDATTLEQLKASNRPAQTINLVLSTVNAVIGEQITSRQEISFKPANALANQETSAALSLVFKQIEANNNSRWVETQVCSDGLIEERGYFDLRMDFSDNIFGEVRETALDPRDVMLDPGAKEYDPSTWTEVIVTRWLTPDEIEALYGKEKADELRYTTGEMTFSTDSVLFDTETFAQDRSKFLFSPTADGYAYPDEFRRVRRIRVVDRQYRKMDRCMYFVDPNLGDMRKVPETWDTPRAAEFAARVGLLVSKRPERRIRWTVTADSVMLFDKWSPYKNFTTIPFFPYFRRGRPIGLVTNLVGPQDTLNKVISQELHVVNTSANSGWVFQSGSLVNMTAEQLMQVGAKTGLVLEYSRNFEPPTKIQPNQVPTGLDRISEKTGRFFREISGVSDAMLGQPGREISGVALDQKRKGGLTQLEIVFDNLARTRHMRAAAILDMVQTFYTEERLLHITHRNIDGDDEQGQVTVNQQTPEGTIMNDLTLGEYTVVVASSNLRDNDEETRFAQLMQLREAGVMIPDWAIIETSNISNKAELVQYAKQIAGALEPTEEEIAEQEMMKQLQMEGTIAQIEEQKAKAAERMANVQLLMAKTETEGAKVPIELQKLQQDAVYEMARLDAEQAQLQGELMARMQIAAAKSDELKHATNMQTLASRMDTESTERTEMTKALTKSVDTRTMAKTQERIAALNAAVKARVASRQKAAQKR